MTNKENGSRDFDNGDTHRSRGGKGLKNGFQIIENSLHQRYYDGSLRDDLEIVFDPEYFKSLDPENQKQVKKQARKNLRDTEERKHRNK